MSVEDTGFCGQDRLGIVTAGRAKTEIKRHTGQTQGRAEESKRFGIDLVFYHSRLPGQTDVRVTLTFSIEMKSARIGLAFSQSALIVTVVGVPWSEAAKLRHIDRETPEKVLDGVLALW